MNIHQHPGIVNQGRLAPGLETVPLLKFVGNQKIYQKDVSSDLHTQLINLLLKSGFGGTFTVVVMTKVKGTPHTRGLHVRSANAKGVVITWHQGSNDNNIQMLVCVPSRYDPMHFFSLLKQTEQCLGQQKVFEAVVSSARADPQLRLEPGNIDSIPATVEALAMSDESACPVEMRLVANNQGPLGVQEGFKYKPGPDAIELLMDELRGLATPEGVVSMERCREILVRMQYPTERLGGVYHSLLSAQHLERVEEMEGFFRLGPQWRERFSISLSLSVTPLSRSDVVTVPSAAIVEKNETPQYITAPETPVTKATLAPVHVELQKLARRAHIASEKRKRLGEVQTELAQIAELIRVQSERHTTLIGEQQLLTGHLATPELCDAEKLLAEINAMLGLS